MTLTDSTAIPSAFKPC